MVDVVGVASKVDHRCCQIKSVDDFDIGSEFGDVKRCLRLGALSVERLVGVGLCKDIVWVALPRE